MSPIPSYNLGSVEGQIRIDYNGQGTTAARTDIEQLVRTATGQEILLRVGGDITRLRATLDIAQAELRRLEALAPSVEVDAEIARARANIGVLEGEIRRIEDVEIDVDANTAPAESAFDGLKARAAIAGAAIGAVLTQALGNAIAQQDATANLQAQLGLTPEYAQKYGKIAGELYANNFGGSMEEVNTAIMALQNQIGDLGDFSEAEIKGMAEAALGLSTTFGVDVTEATRAAGQMMKTGLAANATEAFDIIASGFQGGANASDDFLETINEYSVQFDKIGVSGAEMTNLLQQGLQGGARDADLVADAFKEFSIRSVDGSKEAAASFEALGFNAQEMTAKFARGGPEAREALNQVFEALKTTEGQSDAATIAFGLFGTQSEDLGNVLYQLDPAMAGVAAKAGDAAGTMAEVNATMGETAAAKIETAKRAFEGMTTSLVAMDGPMGTVVAGAMAMGPEMLTMGAAIVTAGATAGPALLGIVTRLGAMALAAVTATATFVAQVAIQVASWILMGVVAVTNATITAGAWLIAHGASMAVAVAGMLATTALTIASWIRMSAIAVAHAAIIAAAWLMANPIVLIIAALVAIIAVVIYYWDEILAFLIGIWETIKQVVVDGWNIVVGWFQQKGAEISAAWTTAWNAIWSFLTGIWERIKSTVQNAIDTVRNTVQNVLDGIRNTWTNVWNAIFTFINTVWTNIQNAFRNGFDMLRNAVQNGIQNVLTFFRNLPGNIVSAVGNLGNLLFNAGRSVVTGIWNGIVSMGNWLYDTIWGWIRSMIPGPIQDALGIASPSKYMADYVGAEVPAGIMVGMQANEGGMIAQAKSMTEDMMAAAQMGLDVNGLAMAGSYVADIGVGASTFTAAGDTTTSASYMTNIGSLELKVTGNLDPTNPVQWRSAIEQIQEELVNVEASYR